MTAPDRIWAGPDAVLGWAYITAEHKPWPELDRTTEFIRRDPAALAADETVRAMIGAVVEDAKAIIADFPTPHREDVMHGHEDAYRALEVFHPDAAAALERALQAERVKALEEAARRCEAIRGDFYGKERAAAIRALKEAP